MPICEADHADRHQKHRAGEPLRRATIHRATLGESHNQGGQFYKPITHLSFLIVFLVERIL